MENENITHEPDQPQAPAEEPKDILTLFEDVIIGIAEAILKSEDINPKR